jgi:hypothetical protein
VNDVLKKSRTAPGCHHADSGLGRENFLENYGNELEVVDLTAEEMQFMFGDQVFYGDDACTLIPSARRWME